MRYSATISHEVSNIYDPDCELVTVEIEIEYDVIKGDALVNYIGGIQNIVVIATDNDLFCIEWAQNWIDAQSESALDALGYIDALY